MYKKCSDQLSSAGISQVSSESPSQASGCSCVSESQSLLAASRPSLPRKCSFLSGKPSKWLSAPSGLVKYARVKASPAYSPPALSAEYYLRSDSVASMPRMPSGQLSSLPRR